MQGELLKKFGKCIKGKVYENVPLKDKTTFGIGGNAAIFIEPTKISDIKRAINLCNKLNIDYFILGAGSNLLVSDEGYTGVVISLKNINFIKRKKGLIWAGAGVRLTALVTYCAQNALSGLEWACGIPGTVGGAVTMNAGAFKGCMEDVVEYVRVLEDGKVKIWDKSKIFFQYRSSAFTNTNKYVILSVGLKLNYSDAFEIGEKIKRFAILRSGSQNVGYRSAGSVFKICGTRAASELIDKAGLKGEKVGEAMVSPVHAGYIVNVGNARAADVWQLINIIRERVEEKFDEKLELEIICIGEGFDEK